MHIRKPLNERERAKLKDPLTLFSKFEDYVETLSGSAKYEVSELVKYKGFHTEAYRGINRPPTMVGFCAFCGVSKMFFNQHYARCMERRDKGEPFASDDGYIGIIDYIKGAIEAEQLDGALVDVYSSTIVARLLGLVDKQEVNDTRHAVRIEVRDSKTATALDAITNLLNADSGLF